MIELKRAGEKIKNTVNNGSKLKGHESSDDNFEHFTCHNHNASKGNINGRCPSTQKGLHLLFHSRAKAREGVFCVSICTGVPVTQAK